MIRLIQGDCRDVLKTLPDASVQCCITSPPYFGLRDYGVAGQIGLEETPDAYVSELLVVFREVRRVLSDDGTLWLNLGDSYTSGGRTWRDDDAMNKARGMSCRAPTPEGLKPKDLIGIPWRVAFALQADGWYLRQDIIWHKPNPMPESVRDRCTKAHEYLFLLSKAPSYYFSHEAMQEPASGREPGNKSHKHVDRVVEEVASGNHRERTKLGLATVGARETRNRRSVWTVSTKPYKGAHFATFPLGLVEPCVLAGSRPGDLVLDPFAGAGTTGLAAARLQRGAVLIELNPDYAALAEARIASDAPLFAGVTLDPLDRHREIAR